MIPYSPELVAVLEEHLRKLRRTLAIAWLALAVEAAALLVVALVALKR